MVFSVLFDYERVEDDGYVYSNTRWLRTTNVLLASVHTIGSGQKGGVYRKGVVEVVEGATSVAF